MIIKLHDKGPAVEDVQNRLAIIGLLDVNNVTGDFDETTGQAVLAFCEKVGLPSVAEINDKSWAALVDASFELGDRTLYLRMPYFHGHDVRELQQALGALGFPCGEDGIFGAHTELALRKFQLNLGLPSDGIAGAYTYAALHNLQHSWVGKGAPHTTLYIGFARAADVLENNALCLFGTDEFTRSVASRMSNLALATNPVSRIVSAEALSVAPERSMLLVQIAFTGSKRAPQVPVVAYTDEGDLSLRMASAINAARQSGVYRVVIELPGITWEDAGAERSAQHFAITLLDALCSALS